MSGMDAPVAGDPPPTLDEECREAFRWMSAHWQQLGIRDKRDFVRRIDGVLDEWLANCKLEGRR